jgi:hypothetical protein
MASGPRNAALWAQNAVLFWGTTASERELRFACDRYLKEPDGVYFRGISVSAPRAIVFRWLCQLRVAPYSYDWLDNPGFYVGRPSPRTLTPGLERLEPGQTFMTMFRLVEFEQDRHITLVARRFHRAFGDVAVTYLITSGGARSRLVVKLIGRYPRGVIGRILQRPLPWIDLVMMRRQLTRLRDLAERDAEDSGRIDHLPR